MPTDQKQNLTLRRIVSTQKGFLLIASLTLLTILTLLGTTAYILSSTDIKIGGNFRNATNAFYSAEAGLAHSRRYLLQSTITPGFSSLLTGSTGSPPTPVAVAALQNICSFGSGGGCYSISIANNTPPDPDSQIDTDGKLWVTSVGTYSGSTQRVRALMEFKTVIGPPAALDVRNGTDSGGPVNLEFEGTSFLVTGNDTAAPTPTGSCGTPGSPKRGIVAETSGALSSVDSAIDSSQAARVTGLGGNQSIAMDNSLTLTQMQTQRSALLPLVTQTLSSGSYSSNIGTPTAPKIVHVSDDLELSGTGNTGYGILIVDGRLRMREGYVWEGLVIVIGQGELEMEDNAAIYGSIMVANTDGSNSGETRIRIEDSAKIAYSSQALCRASQSLPTTVLSWQRLD